MVEAIAPHLRRDAIVVTKSTVPVGTTAQIAARLKELTGRECDVASNPEFLKEGAALDDFQKPDRVVVGVRRPEVAEVLRELYAPFLRTEKPFLVMSPESSEMTKYVANAMLATKISFINEMANLCERMQADINDVRRGIGHDSRIGFAFLFPGVGYGGSCFPKDVRALVIDGPAARHAAANSGCRARASTIARKRCSREKIEQHFGGQVERQDDRHLGSGVQAAHRRHSRCTGAGADRSSARTGRQSCRSTIRKRWPTCAPFTATSSPTAICRSTPSKGADALAIVTEWGEFRTPDFEEMSRADEAAGRFSTAAISTSRANEVVRLHVSLHGENTGYSASEIGDD